MATLGEKLAQNAILSDRKDTAYMLESARQAGPEALAKFQKIQDFFLAARDQISEAIENGDAKVSIKVGGEPKDAPHMEVWHLLSAGQYGNDPMKTLASERHPYHCLWRDFSDWAIENELVVAIEYRHDGGGMHSWFDLVCKPSPLLMRERASVPRG